MFNTTNKFGQNNIQNRVQKRFHSEGLAGKRRSDPQLHATSRPYHTSTAGIMMSVGMNRQIAEQAGPRAVKYLNQMTLSQMAQQKRGRNSDPAHGYKDGKEGFDSIKGLRHRVNSSALNKSPNGGALQRQYQSLLSRRSDIEARTATAVGQASTNYTNQLNAISGALNKTKKMLPKKYF